MCRFYTSYCFVSTVDLIQLFHHRWAVPALALLDERGGVRFVELQRKLDVGRASLQRGLEALIALGYVRRNEGYGHPLRPEYVVTADGRAAAPLARDVLKAAERDTLLLKWSVPVLAALRVDLRFSELRSALPGVTPRALALALRELEDARLVRREVRPTRPPSTVYRATARGRRLVGAAP
jgi:DNA-binding HxlR family transcriptional regulator